MRVMICWHSISGYMAACWRALAAIPGVELLVVTQRPDLSGPAPFDASVVAGVRTEMLEPARLNDPRSVVAVRDEFRPDVIVLNGWFVPAFNELARTPGSGARAKIVMAMDRPRESVFKDHATRVRKRSFLRCVDLVFVAGERCREFARFLGFEERQIRRGTYGVDYEGLTPVAQARQDRASAGGGWPRAFIYIGRYAPEKDLSTLLAGYAEYRSMVESSWALNTCGKGELAALLRGAPGVTDLGFVQPREQPRMLGEQGVLVLVSKFEPWGAVVAEAAAAGLPLICSSAVGASVELVQPYHNGLVVAPGDVRGVARAMRWMHEHEDQLPAMGRRSREMAAGAGAGNWAVRWHEAFKDLLEE